MCYRKLRRLIGFGAAALGAGILLSYILPGFILAFAEAIILIVAGFMLLKK